MFKQLADLVTRLLFLAHDTQENKEAIKQLRGEVDELAAAVENLSFEIRQMTDRNKHEHEKLVLQLENMILRLERRLPQGKSSKN